MTPEDLLNNLKINASPRTAKTLNAIYEICNEQVSHGQQDFSVSTIARLGFQRGVPKAQSLRNKTGENYRALLRAFEEKYSRNKSRKASKKGEHDWIDEIDNPKHRLLARMQASELQAANKKLRDFIPPGTRIVVRDHQNINDGEEFLSDLERRALEYLLSKRFLDKWNFEIGDAGQIVDSEGKMVLQVATVEAINKVLNHLG